MERNATRTAVADAPLKRPIKSIRLERATGLSHEMVAVTIESKSEDRNADVWGNANMILNMWSMRSLARRQFALGVLQQESGINHDRILAPYDLNPYRADDQIDVTFTFQDYEPFTITYELDLEATHDLAQHLWRIWAEVAGIYINTYRHSSLEEWKNFCSRSVIPEMEAKAKLRLDTLLIPYYLIEQELDCYSPRNAFR